MKLSPAAAATLLGLGFLLFGGRRSSRAPARRPAQPGTRRREDADMIVPPPPSREMTQAAEALARTAAGELRDYLARGGRERSQVAIYQRKMGIQNPGGRVGSITRRRAEALGVQLPRQNRIHRDVRG